MLEQIALTLLPFSFHRRVFISGKRAKGREGKRPGREESRYKVKLFLQSFKLSRVTSLNLSETELPIHSQISTSNKLSWATIN